MTDVRGRKRLGAQNAVVCYSEGCPKHEPPESECTDCTIAFWSAVLPPPADAPGGGS